MLRITSTPETMYWRAVLVIHLATYVFAKVDYTGHQVLGITPTSDTAAKILYKLLEDETLDLDPWTEGARERSIPVRVPPHSLAKFRRRLEYHNIPNEVIIPDVQKLIDQEAASVYGPRQFIDKSMIRLRRSINQGPPRHIVDETLKVLFNTISTFSGHQIINDWLDSMSELLPEIGRTEVIGNSTHGRPLKMIKIGRPRPDGKPKKIILVDALIHAREWVTQSTALYMIFQLMRGDGTDPEMTTLVDTFDWHILPVLNPDGYEYSHSEERLWRKTRSYYRRDLPRKRRCVGVDANRNFGYHWKGGYGHCDHAYSGPRPFSEPETSALKNYMLKHKNNIAMYLSLHSPIQKWLTPWGHTNEEPHDNEDIKRVAQAAADAMREQHGITFEAGPISSFLFPVHGSSIDWAKGVAGIKYAFAPELRSKQVSSNYKYQLYYFIIPTSQLIPAGEETWAAVRAAVEEVMVIENIKAYKKSATILDEEEELEEILKHLPLTNTNDLLHRSEQTLRSLESRNANSSTAMDLRMIEVASGQPLPETSSVLSQQTRRTHIQTNANTGRTPRQPTNPRLDGPPDFVDAPDLHDMMLGDSPSQIAAASFNPVTEQPLAISGQEKEAESDHSAESDGDSDDTDDSEVADRTLDRTSADSRTLDRTSADSRTLDRTSADSRTLDRTSVDGRPAQFTPARAPRQDHF